MKIVIAGGAGFLGQALITRLAADGHDLVVLSRQLSSSARMRTVVWRPNGGTGDWAREIDEADVVVNLSGAGIGDRRWTASRKAVLRSSRVPPTRSLVEAVRQSNTRPRVFIQNTAIGYYGRNTSDRIFDESSPPGDDFLARLCVDWEAEAQPASTLGCRLVILRTGPALAAHGGMLARIKLPFLFFVGGPVASGRQYLSWIHMGDWVEMVVWAMRTNTVSGALNSTSPNPVTNAEFQRAIGRALRRPSWLPVPAFALRAMFGQMADDLLVTGQRVLPRRALELGFVFKHPNVDEAMVDVFRSASY